MKNKNQLEQFFEDNKEKLEDFLRKCKNEGDEFNESGNIIRKFLKDKNSVTPKEIEQLREQMIDAHRIGGCTAVFILPFGSVLLALILKWGQKVGIDFVPSSFKK